MTQTVDPVNQIDDQQLFELLHEVVHRFKAVLQAAIADDESGLAQMEVRALVFLGRHTGATAGDLVKRSGRDKGQVARLIGALSERGLVVRAEGNDRRSHTLHLTPEGKAVQRRLERKRARAAATMFASLTSAERATFADLLGRLVGPR
jgi:DNA-binding MarR family transcriptional regulator